MVNKPKVDNQCIDLKDEVKRLDSNRDLESIRKVWKNIQTLYEDNSGYVNENEYECADLIILARNKIIQMQSNFQRDSGSFKMDFMDLANDIEIEYNALNDGRSVDSRGAEESPRKELPGVGSIYRKLDNDEYKEDNEMLREDYAKAKKNAKTEELIKEIIKERIRKFKGIRIDKLGNIDFYELGNIDLATAEKTIIESLRGFQSYNTTRADVISEDPSLEAVDQEPDQRKQVIQEFYNLKGEIENSIFKLYENEVKQGMLIDNSRYFSVAVEKIQKLSKLRKEDLEEAAKINFNQTVVNEYEELVKTLNEFKAHRKADTDIQRLRFRKKELDKLIKEFNEAKSGKLPDKYKSFEDFLIQEYRSKFYHATSRFVDEEMDSVEESINLKNDASIKKEFDDYIDTFERHDNELVALIEGSGRLTLQTFANLEDYDFKGLVKGKIKDKEILRAADLFFDIFDHHMSHAETGMKRFYKRNLKNLGEVRKVLNEKKKEAEKILKTEEESVTTEDAKATIEILEKGFRMTDALEIRIKAAQCKKIETIKSMISGKRNIESAKEDIENAKKTIERLAEESENYAKLDQTLLSNVNGIKKKIDDVYLVIDSLVNCKEEIELKSVEDGKEIIEKTKRLMEEARKIQDSPEGTIAPDLFEIAEQAGKYVEDVFDKKLTEGFPEAPKKTDSEGDMIDYMRALGELQMSEAELQNLITKGALRTSKSRGRMKIRKTDIDDIKDGKEDIGEYFDFVIGEFVTEKKPEKLSIWQAHKLFCDSVNDIFEDEFINLMLPYGMISNPTLIYSKQIETKDFESMIKKLKLPEQDTTYPEKNKKDALTTTTRSLKQIFEEDLPDKPAAAPSLEEQILNDVVALEKKEDKTPKDVLGILEKYSDSFGIPKEIISQYKKRFRIEE